MKIYHRTFAICIILGIAYLLNAQEEKYLPTWSTLARMQEAPGWYPRLMYVDESAIYAILMIKPKPDEMINFESMKGMYKIKSVEMLGSDEAIVWTRPNNLLEITMPQNVPKDMAVVFKLNRYF